MEKTSHDVTDLIPAVTPAIAFAWLMGAAVTLALSACSDSPTVPGGSISPLPESFRMVGSASSSESDGTSVSCELDFFFELTEGPREEPGLLEYRGTHGGSILREVLDASGDGIALWPDVHGEAIVRSLASDRIEIVLPGNQGTESRFWNELAFFEGSLASDGTASGSWKCAPFDIDSGGWIDKRYTASGSWAWQL